MIGPVPFWPESVPALLWRHAHDEGFAPARLAAGRSEHLVRLDADMRAAMLALDVDYVSPLSVLCDERGCLTRLDGLAELTTWDQAHLTTAGSRYFIEHLPPGTLAIRGAGHADRKQ